MASKTNMEASDEDKIVTPNQPDPLQSMSSDSHRDVGCIGFASATLIQMHNQVGMA